MSQSPPATTPSPTPRRPAEVASVHDPIGPRLRGWFTWSRVLLAALLLVGSSVGLNLLRNEAADAFIAFRPERSLFPSAPAAGATTIVGIGRPDGWPSESCPNYSEQRDDALESSFGNEWRTVRHDWTEAGSARAWIISERTIGFTEPNAADDYVEGLRNVTTYCGWRYTGDPFHPEYNSVYTELDGLPTGAFGFTVDASPFNRGRDGFESSNPDDFSALGAVIPHPESNSVMTVMWVGWAADVPRDDFVATANRLFDAAKQSPQPTQTSPADDARIDFDGGYLDVERAGLVDLVGGDAYPGSTEHPPWSKRCKRRQPTSILAGGDESGSGNLEAILGTTVEPQIGTRRWHSRRSYLDAKRRANELVQIPCIDSMQEPGLLIEQIDVAGLPDGAVVTVWHERHDRNRVAAVVTDDVKRMMLIVEWPGEPDDQFVEFVNRAWDEYQAVNP